MHNLAVLTPLGEAGKRDYGARPRNGSARPPNSKRSQFNVAILLARGLGVPQNLTLAYVWLSIGGAQSGGDIIALRAGVVVALARRRSRARHRRASDSAARRGRARAGSRVELAVADADIRRPCGTIARRSHNRACRPSPPSAVSTARLCMARTLPWSAALRYQAMA